MNASLLYPRVTATRRVVSLDGMWKFQFDPKQEGVAAGWTAGLPDACSMRWSILSSWASSKVRPVTM